MAGFQLTLYGRIWVTPKGLSAERNSPSREWVKEVDEPREIYWQMVIEGISTACKIQNVLATCGLAHLGSFSKRLASSGHQVSVKNVRDESWNDESWRPTRKA